LGLEGNDNLGERRFRNLMQHLVTVGEMVAVGGKAVNFLLGGNVS